MQHHRVPPRVEFFYVRLANDVQYNEDDKDLVFAFAGAENIENAASKETIARCLREAALFDALSGISESVGGGPVVRCRRTPINVIDAALANDEEATSSNASDTPLLVISASVDVVDPAILPLSAPTDRLLVRCGVRQGTLSSYSVHNVPLKGLTRSRKGYASLNSQRRHQFLPIDTAVISATLEASARCLLALYPKPTAKNVHQYYTSWLPRFRIDHIHTYLPLYVLPAAPVLSDIPQHTVESLESLLKSLKQALPSVNEVLVFHRSVNFLTLCTPETELSVSALRSLYAYNLFFCADLQPQDVALLDTFSTSKYVESGQKHNDVFASMSSWFKRSFHQATPPSRATLAHYTNISPAPSSSAQHDNIDGLAANPESCPLNTFPVLPVCQTKLHLAQQSTKTDIKVYNLWAWRSEHIIINCLLTTEPSTDVLLPVVDILKPVFDNLPPVVDFTQRSPSRTRFYTISCVADHTAQAENIAFMTPCTTAATAFAISQTYSLLKEDSIYNCREVHLRVAQEPRAASERSLYWTSGKWYPESPNVKTDNEQVSRNKRLVLAAIETGLSGILLDTSSSHESGASPEKISSITALDGESTSALGRASINSLTKAGGLSLMDVATALDLII